MNGKLNTNGELPENSTEITVYVAGVPRKALLQLGFYGVISTSEVLHTHCYEEIHVFHGGEATLMLGNERIRMKSGDILMLPRNTYHTITLNTEGLMHSAFQIDLSGAKLGAVNLSRDLTENYFKELNKLESISSDHSAICSYLSFFGEQFINGDPVYPSSVTDYAFFIREFFSMRYADDIHLSDLAKLLFVSEKQAERLVIKHTGKTFVDELTTTRMEVAEQLMVMEPTPSLTDIASMVGYQSYSGFWKAYKRYKEQ